MSFQCGCRWQRIWQRVGATTDWNHWKKKGVFKKAAEAVGFQFVQKIMVAQAVDTKSLLRLSTSAFRHLRIIFSNIGFKVFRLEVKMRLYESWGLTHLQQTDLAVDKLLLESTGSSMTREIKTVHALTACDLHSYICFFLPS